MSLMGNGGKGDAKRPTQVDEQTFSDNWDRVFAAKKDYYASVREKNYVDSLRLEGFDGARLGANADSKPADVGPIPTAPATSDTAPHELAATTGQVDGRGPITHEVTHGNASEPSHEPVAQAAASSSTDREDGEG